MGMYYIGALLKEHRHEVEILNWSRKPDPGYSRQVILDYKPEIVGFSILNGNRIGAVETARLIKSILPNVPIVAGGVGGTFLWKHLLKRFPEIDVVIRGEGEYAFLHLVQHLESKGTIDELDDIPSVAFRKNNRIQLTGPGNLITNPDDLPNPARYFTYPHVSISRGCPFNCTFCGSPGFWGHNVRFHSPEYFVDQIRLLNEKGVTWFFVSDDTFCMDRNRVLSVCRKLVQENRNLRWAAITRVEDVDEEILFWMRKSRMCSNQLRRGKRIEKNPKNPGKTFGRIKNHTCI